MPKVIGIAHIANKPEHLEEFVYSIYIASSKGIAFKGTANLGFRTVIPNKVYTLSRYFKLHSFVPSQSFGTGFDVQSIYEHVT